MSVTHQSRNAVLTAEVSAHTRRTLCVPLILALVLTGSVALADEHHPHWSYNGATGPAKWGTLEEDYHSCAQGKVQSPIDIKDSEASTADLPAIDFEYKPSPLRIIDNGHTIQVNYAPGSF